MQKVTKRRILLFIAAILQDFYLHITAQSYYMHEAAEDSDGNPGKVVHDLAQEGLYDKKRLEEEIYPNLLSNKNMRLFLSACP